MRKFKRGDIVIYQKTREEIELMRHSNSLVSQCHAELAKMLKPGITTMALNVFIEKFIRDNGGVPSFLNYKVGDLRFPFSACISVNDAVVHGFPGNRELKDGDIVSIDIGVFKNGFHGDSCITVAVGNVSEKAAKLMRVAEEALYKGIEQVKPGNCMLDLAGAIEDHVKANGFVIVEDFTGHGVGRNLHEEPSVFNFRTHQLPNVRFRPGMTLAIEPIVNAGSKRVRILADKWTAVTVDNQLSAQFEHTVLVTETGYEIFTDRHKI